MSEYFLTANGELYHYGVKGIKRGIRRFQRKDGTRTAAGKKRLQELYDENAPKKSKGTPSNKSTAKKSIDNKPTTSKKSTAKKAAVVGAAFVGTALAAYGGYKVAKYVQGKRSEKAMQKASDYINKNFLNKVGDSKFANGKTISNFENKLGTRIDIEGRGSKAIGKYNAGVVSKGRQIYKDATDTRLDRGLNKVVGAGDAVGNAAKRAGRATGNAAKSAGNAAKRGATTAKNRVLDVVNPIYAYTPGESGSTTRMVNGLKVTESFTNYKRRKVRR